MGCATNHVALRSLIVSTSLWLALDLHLVMRYIEQTQTDLANFLLQKVSAEYSRTVTNLSLADT